MTESEERGKDVFEAIIRAARPGLAFRWEKNLETEIHTVVMAGNVRMEISQDAVEQAADEPNALPRLRVEVEKALQVSESGTAIGFVSET